MIRRCSSRLCCVVPGCSWWWFSEPSLGGFLGVFSGPCSYGFDGENSCEPFVVLLLLIPLPNPWVKGLDFGVIGVLLSHPEISNFRMSIERIVKLQFSHNVKTFSNIYFLYTKYSIWKILVWFSKLNKKLRVLPSCRCISVLLECKRIQRCV
jgi:hypothetical protein